MYLQFNYYPVGSLYRLKETELPRMPVTLSVVNKYYYCLIYQSFGILICRMERIKSTFMVVMNINWDNVHVKMPTILKEKKTDNNECWQEHGETSYIAGGI